MPDDKDKDKQAEAKLTEDLSKVTTSEEIRDVLASQPRDEHGKFVSTKVEAKKEPEAAPITEPTVYKDAFLLGGKEVEFSGDSPQDVLKQFKAAQQAYEMARTLVEPKKEEIKPAGPTKEELSALQLKAASGDAEAMSEYMVKSGALDRYLESKGIRPAEIQQVLQERASEKVVKDWDGAVKDFLSDSDWPGGTQNEKLLKYKLAELKDDSGQPLAYSPSKQSLQRAYEALKEEKMLFTPEPKTEEEKKTTSAVVPISQSKPSDAPKRGASGSTLFGTSQETGTRKVAPNTPKVPEISPDATPQEIMAAWKESVLASGQSPDDALRNTYSDRR
jgi:hypothetical protein